MKKLLFLPLLALPLLVLSCDQVPTEPEAASSAADPLFAKTPPNALLDYELLRMNVRYSGKTQWLKVKVAFKNVSVKECGEQQPSITLFFRQVSPVPTGFALLRGAMLVCDSPGGGGGSTNEGFHPMTFIPGVAEIRAVINDAQTGDGDVLDKEFTVR